MSYKLIHEPIRNNTNSVKYYESGKEEERIIPFDAENTDYQIYLEWVAAGNTAEAADTIPAWDQVRTKRDNLLVSSDWTMVTGATVDQAQWAAYRDKLRAIPQTFKNVSDPLTEITWPTAPSTKGPNTT